MLITFLANLSCSMFSFCETSLSWMEHGDRSLNEIARLYDVNYGSPPLREVTGTLLEDVMQEEIFKIQKVNSFEDCFFYIGVTS